MTLEEFFHKVCEDYERLAKDIADFGLAMNCVLWLYHLHGVDLVPLEEPVRSADDTGYP